MLIKRVLGNDPGHKNYAWSVLAYPKKVFPRIIDADKLPTSSIVQDFGDGLGRELDIFEGNISRFMDFYRVHMFATERYINRGRFFGKMVETITLMNTSAIGLARDRDLKYKFVSSVVWKNQVRFTTGHKIEVLYKAIKDEMKRGDPLKEHVHHMTDCALIGAYSAGWGLDFLRDPKVIPKFFLPLMQYVTL